LNKNILLIILFSFASFIYGVYSGMNETLSKRVAKFIERKLNTSGISNEYNYYHFKLDMFESTINNTKPKYAMIGDSITELGIWNELLSRNDIVNRGISGDVTKGVLKRVKVVDTLQPTINKVFLMIGLNDIKEKRDTKDIYETYIKILNSLEEKNISPIVQSTLLTAQNKAHIYNAKIKALNKKLADYCIENNIIFIDLNKILTTNDLLKKEYTSDGIHLNIHGYKIWSNEIKKHLD
jgi:lysophospholipase L1-like esterase